MSILFSNDWPLILYVATTDFLANMQLKHSQASNLRQPINNALICRVLRIMGLKVLRIVVNLARPLQVLNCRCNELIVFAHLWLTGIN